MNGNKATQWLARAATAVTALTVSSLAILGTQAHAQADWPKQEIHIVVPWPAGGESDTYIRALGQSLSDQLKQPVIVDNKPGATGAIGVTHVARSKPDGYTYLFGNSTALVGNVVSSTVPLQFDPQKDFAPVAITVESTYVLWANPATGIKSFDDFLKRAREKDKEPLAFGITGPGSLSELSVEQLAHEYGVGALKCHPSIDQGFQAP